MTPFSLTADEHRRIEHIDQLSIIGAAGIAELITTMSDPSWTVRRACVAALAAAGDDAAPALVVWLAEMRTSEHAIAAAVDALAASIGAQANAAIQGLFTSADPAVITDGISILGRRRAKEMAPAIEALLGHADDNVAIAAIDALGSIGEGSSIEPLIRVLGGDSFFRTFAVLQALPKIADPRAIAPLAKLLDADMYRIEAVNALGRTGSVLAIAPLAGLLARVPGDALIRPLGRAFADLLARATWSGTGEPAIAELRARLSGSLARFAAALRSADGEERAAIAKLLGQIGDASVLPALARLLDEPALAEIAIEAVQRIGRGADGAVLEALQTGDTATRAAVLPVVTTAAAGPSVTAMLSDDSPELRVAACEAVARIGDVSAVPVLFGLLGDPNPRVAHGAAAAIQSLGSAETGTRAIAALTDGTPAVRRQALRIIAYLGRVETFDAVRAAIDDRDPRIAELAVAALAAIDEPRTDPALAELARDPRDPVRAAAMRALGLRGHEALLVIGTEDPAAWVRYYACQGLGRIGAGAEALIARLADPAPHVRIAALEALAHVATDAAWEALSTAARSAEPDERRAALAGLPARPEALSFLLDAAVGGDEATRLIALAGLARRTEPEALAALVSAARAPAVELRDAAISLLVERADRPAAEAALDVALAADLDQPIHLALSQPSPARIAAISERLQTSDEHATTVLVAALARMRADAALISALSLANPIARRLAGITLIALGARADAEPLATTDPDLDVRRAIAAAL